MSNESVYDIIKEIPPAFQKGLMYKSVLKGKDIPPTYSTFGLENTSVVVGNAGGYADQDVPCVHPAKKTFGSFGKYVVDSISPTDFLKTSGNKGVQPGQNKDSHFKRICTKNEETGEGYRAPVPLRDEKPPMNYRSDVNYILQNAATVNNYSYKTAAATEATGAAPVVMTRGLDRCTFGETPVYVRERQAELADEKRGIAEAMTKMKNDQRTLYKMKIEEIQQLRNDLNSRWNELSKQLAKMGFQVETRAQRSQKEQIELQMRTIEVALRKIGRDNIWMFDEDKIY